MKPFKFKLETALYIKEKEEERQKEKLAQASQVYQDNLKRLKELKDRQAQLYDILRRKQAEEVNIYEIQRCQDYVPVLSGRIKQQEAVTEVSREEMEAERRLLIEIMKNRKLLEKLKARHYQEYYKDCLREEQKQIDEMATNGYVHRGSAV